MSARTATRRTAERDRVLLRSSVLPVGDGARTRARRAGSGGAGGARFAGPARATPRAVDRLCRLQRERRNLGVRALARPKRATVLPRPGPPLLGTTATSDMQRVNARLYFILEPRLDTLTLVSIDTWTLLDTIDMSDTSVNRHTPTPLRHCLDTLRHA